MTTSIAAEKIIEGLAQMMEGFAALQEHIEKEFGADGDEESEVDDSSSSELSLEIDAAIVNEMRAVIENVLETEDYAPEEVAALVSTMTDALEEIDPDVFDDGEEDDEEEDSAAEYEDDEEYYDEYDEMDEDYADEEFGDDEVE